MPALRRDGDVVSGVPAVVEVVLSRWVLGGAVAVILLVVGVLAWGSARGAALADGRDYPAEAYALLHPGARVYHPAYGLGRVAIKPEFAGHVFVDFDDDRETGRLVPAVDLSPVDPQDEERIADLLERGAVLHFGPRPSPTPGPPVCAPGCTRHRPDDCVEVRCCPTCPTNPQH